MVWNDAFAQKGKVIEAESRRITTDKPGTVVSFLPNPEVFGADQSWDTGLIERRLRELAAFMPQATWKLLDHRERYIQSKNGLKDLLINQPHWIIGSPFLEGVFELIEQGCWVHWALGYKHCSETQLFGYTNWITCDKGTHVRAFETALAVVQCKLEIEGSPKLGLIGVVQIKLIEPKFASPSRETLSRADLAKPLKIAFKQSLQSALAQNAGWLTFKLD
jgi:DNA gyrase/topoisomerase IV subunit B